MSELIATHRTRAGVSVGAIEQPDGDRVYISVKLSSDDIIGMLFSKTEFAALFEPIPKPRMVSVSLACAKAVADFLHSRRDCPQCDVFRTAIAAAEGDADDK